MLLHTADKSFQGTEESFHHAASSKSVSGLASIIPDFQAHCTTISTIFEWMSYVANTIWHIVKMDMWNEDYCNMEGQAFIRIGSNGMDDFQFGLVSGEIDGDVIQTGNVELFEFTWEGQDECDPASGSGWLKFSGENKLKGRIKFHLGDSSEFIAVRAEDR